MAPGWKGQGISGQSRASKLALVVAAALLIVAPICYAVVLQDTTFSMSFRVQKDEFDRALVETRELLKFAEEKGMAKNTIMFIRTAGDKVEGTLKEFAKLKEEEETAEARKAKAGPAPLVFIHDKEIAVRPLKSDGAKKCNIKRYKAGELEGLLGAGKIDLKKPFIVTDAIPVLDDLRRQYTSETLMQNLEVQLRYLSPVKAKEKRTFDKQESAGPEDEQLEYSSVTMEKYFQNCFNFKAKPDFRKTGGADTEHCEQSVAASLLQAANATVPTNGVAGQLGWLQMLEPGRDKFVSRAADLQDLVNPKADLKSSLQRGSSKFFVFGPAGSGEQLRQEGSAFADGLVHGKRRWFLMAPKDFERLREVAKDTLEPASAFMFFEQQFEELVEDHGLGGKKMKYWECNQNPGEIIYIPANVIMTSLSQTDSFSYKQNIATSHTAVVDRVNSNVWDPESGMVPNGYHFGACFDNMDLSRAGTLLQKPINPMQGQIIQQIMSQYYAGPLAQNQIIISLLAECASVMESADLDASRTHCPDIWNPCVAQLEKNAKALSKSLPEWLKAKPSGKPEL